MRKSFGLKFFSLFIILGLVISGLLIYRNHWGQLVSITSTAIPPVYQGQTGQNCVALVFNIDWGEEYLPSILQTLQEQQVSVTFMVTGRWAKLHPDLVYRMVQEGHEIGNHSYSHPHPNKLSRHQLLKEINQTQAVIEEITGQTTKVFAPPYGEFNTSVLAVAQSLGYPVIMWTLDTVDWRRPQPSRIVQRIKDKIQPDFIVLMHPTEPTAAALPQILSFLKEKNYKLLTVSEIILKG